MTAAKIFIYIHVMNVKNYWKYSRTENEKREPRNLKSSLKCTLQILWIYYDYHSITLLRSLYLALEADSDSNGCHLYHGWQYFAGRFSFKFRSKPQHLFSLSRIWLHFILLISDFHDHGVFMPLLWFVKTICIILSIVIF